MTVGDPPPAKGEGGYPVLPRAAVAELERWMRELRALDLDGWKPFIPASWRMPAERETEDRRP